MNKLLTKYEQIMNKVNCKLFVNNERHMPKDGFPSFGDCLYQSLEYFVPIVFAKSMARLMI